MHGISKVIALCPLGFIILTHSFFTFLKIVNIWTFFIVAPKREKPTLQAL